MDKIALYSKPPSGVDHHEYDERIKLAVDSNDAGVITVTFLKMIKEGQVKNFAQFEKDLRRLDLPVHLIAVPRALRPPDLGVIGLDGQDADFSLWVCLHGRAEALEKLAQIGVVSFKQNLSNLEHTGLLRIG